MNKDNELIV